MPRNSEKKQDREAAQRLHEQVVNGQLKDAAAARKQRAEYRKQLADPNEWDKAALRYGIARQTERLETAQWNLKGLRVDSNGNSTKKKWWQS